MASENYLDELNDAQRRAVEYLDGPELVIAGAGSGKTRVLTYKIVHLLTRGHYPNRILALTFTNKAANEMRERISALVGEQTASRLWMGTFHSIFARFLRIHSDRIGFKSDFTIYDASDSKSLIRSIIREMKLDDKVYRPGAVVNEISNAKNNLYSPENYAADRDIQMANRAAGVDRMHEIYSTYMDRCRVAGAMDFDDLLYYTNILFRDNPDVLAYYSDYFSYVLVDEYQDTNFAQHLIVRQLCRSKGALCVVGDDAQSIYSFRGANIRNILEMKRTFPALETFKLEQNYRSTRNIIGAANTLIAANKEQIHKEVFSENSAGERIEVVECFDEGREAAIVAARINRIRMNLQIPAGEVAVLYRTNSQSRVLEEELRRRNIPYRVYGGLAFYQRKEIKDALCYFRLACNPDDDEALRRVINTPRRGIGETTEAKIMAAAFEHKTSLFAVMADPVAYGLKVNRGTAAKLEGFVALIRSFNEENAAGTDASTLAHNIIERTGLMAEYTIDTTPENVSKIENVAELLSGVEEFTDSTRQTEGEDRIGLSNYLAGISLLTDQDTADADDIENCVTLMTIHAAKGLEFGAVFVVGVEEDLLPYAKSIHSPSEVEEERRLLYVAITRAKQFCMISFARQRTLNGRTGPTLPSRFLRDIDSRFLRPVGGTRLGAPGRHEPVFSPGPAATGGGQQFVRPSLIHPTASIDSGRDMPRPVPQAPATASGGDYTVHSSSGLSVGLTIEHPRFGHGVINDIDTTRPDHRISVDFGGEIRVLLLKFAKFKIVRN